MFSSVVLELAPAGQPPQQPPRNASSSPEASSSPFTFESWLNAQPTAPGVGSEPQPFHTSVVFVHLNTCHLTATL